MDLEKRPQPGGASRRGQGEQKPYAEAEIRASDADRDRIAEILRDALAEGRLTPEEHSERIDAAYAAKTVGELEPIVRDLPARRSAPAAEPAAAPLPVAESSTPGHNVVAVFGGATRKGRWRVGPRTNAFACFGGIEIDLTEAVFEQRETVINVVAVFGGVEVKVPENVTLRGSGAGIFGGFEVKTHESEDPDAPVVVLTGAAIFGGVDAKPRRGKRVARLQR
ncbi:DUF1707 SHOCT-like domain-containing protein [Streptomyces humicola]|uniref:DUF1707 SHOCT-like domain-containing protein n=1 Tax=Streptomyces humicola TaxID=2953240 RepID=UPI003555CDF4